MGTESARGVYATVEGSGRHLSRVPGRGEPMDAGRFRGVRELFEQALGRRPEERASFLDVSCGGDAELRAEVERLLAADGAAGGFLEQPALGPGFELPPAFAKGADAPDHTAGERIGPYKILRRIGTGGMSEVYLGVRADDEFQKRVALKIIRHDLGTEDRVRRFRTERQILAGLDHPAIAKMLDGGTTESGLPYFVMDYVEGVPIDEYCDRSRLSVRERLELFLTVCSAIQYAHQNLIVHRDVKPSNILVTAEGQVKLLDFGIAKLLRPDLVALEMEHTATWVRPMTPRYASPEQVQGKLVTTASDVYSLGVLLYELLTGHLPYRLEGRPPTELGRLVVDQEPERPSTAIGRVETGMSRRAPETPVTLDSVSQARATPPPQLRRQLSGDLDNIVLMALRKEAQRRYASAEQLAEDVRRYLKGLPVLARKDTLSYRTAKFVRRNWLGVGVAAAFVLLLVGFALTMALQARRIAHERDQAKVERDRAEQVVGFMQKIFEVSDPAEAKGEEISAREILDRGAARVQQDLKNQPEVRATLIAAIGNVYKSLGSYDRARELLEEALATREQLYPGDSTQVADSLHDVGLVLDLQGNPAAAETFLRKALAMRQKLAGGQHPPVAASLNLLGSVVRRQGRYEEAAELYRMALSMEPTLGMHETVMSAKNDLAALLVEVGDPKGAEPLLHEALGMCRQLFGEKSLPVAQGMSNLGAVLGMQGKYVEAEPYLRGALALYRKLLDVDHPVLADSLNNLAKLLQRKSEFDAAEALLREALRIERKRLGPRHPKVALRAFNMSELLQDQGKLGEAEAFARESLEIRRGSLGSDHADVGSSLSRLGDVLVEAGQPREAEPVLRESLRILEAALPSDHWRTANARSLFGRCLAAQGMFEEAGPLLLAGYEALRDQPRVEPRYVHGAHTRLVSFYEALGKPEAASAVGGADRPQKTNAP